MDKILRKDTATPDNLVRTATIILFLISLSAFSMPVQDNLASRESHPIYFWVDLGFGAGTEMPMTMGVFKVNAGYKNIMAAYESTAGERFCDLMCNDDGIPRFEETNALVGIRKVGHHGYSYLATGLGRFEWTTYADGSLITHKTNSALGIPIEAGVAYAGFFGIGLILHANLNSTYSVWGLYLDIPIGKSN